MAKFKNVTEPYNYGFYFGGAADRESGYLDDSQVMLGYQFTNNTDLILRKKGRILTGIPEKQLQKWNNKKQQKEFLSWIQKKGLLFTFSLFFPLCFFIFFI